MLLLRLFQFAEYFKYGLNVIRNPLQFPGVIIIFYLSSGFRIRIRIGFYFFLIFIFSMFYCASKISPYSSNILNVNLCMVE